MSGIKEIIDSPHPVYTANLAYWNFLLQSYEGGKNYTNATVLTGSAHDGNILDNMFVKVFAGGKQIDKSSVEGNLFRHVRETNADFATRIKMSYYYNFCAPIIDIYTNHLFKQAILEEWANIEKAVEARQEDIDRMGSSLDEYRTTLFNLTQVYGHMYTVIDVPAAQGTINNLQDKIEQGAFPYFVDVHPQNVTNWDIDRFGQLNWIMILENESDNADPMNYKKEDASKKMYRLWTRTEWILFNGDSQEIGRGAHNLGVVPVTLTFDKKSRTVKNCLGVSAIADIAFIARDVYNSSSELRQILRDQTFSILTLQGKANEYNQISVGTNKGLLYPEERERPGYISPQVENAQNYFDHINNQVTKMFQLAKLEGGSANQNQTSDVKSGTSKAWDFNETNACLSQKASNMQDAEMKRWEIFARWEGHKAFEGNVTYGTNFDVQSLNDDLDEAEKTLKLQMGKEFNIEIKKSIAKKKFPRMPEEEMDKILEEIETAEGQEESGSLLAKLGIKQKNGDLPEKKGETQNAFIKKPI